MNTMTTVSTGACSTGRIRMRSISIPPTNEAATVITKASHQLIPPSISDHAR